MCERFAALRPLVDGEKVGDCVPALLEEDFGRVVMEVEQGVVDVCDDYALLFEAQPEERVLVAIAF